MQCFFSGAIVLILCSALQKVFVGVNPFDVSGYLVSFIYGGISGVVIHKLIKKKKRLIQEKLDMEINIRRQLEKEVKSRTQELIDANTKLKEMATKDGLTGLYNHNTIHDLIEKQIKDIDDKGNLSICMFDIDYFKKINDRFGHKKGDYILKK